MFNNTAFDVVIGMVLIYLLYSLLVTVVGEMLSTWMAMRSRILRVAIEKMLNDGYLDTKGQWRYNNWWHFAQRFFLKEFEGFKDSFAGKFYQQASIKYLSNRVGEKITYFSQTKPSYISDTNFADTLVAMLTGRGQGNDDMAKIAYCLTHNLCLIQPQTRAHLQRLMTEAAGDITVFKTKLKQWFNETNDRATGWYKRKMQLILFWVGFILAAAFNVDSIAIAKFLAKDKEARNNLTSMAVAVVRDSVRYQPLLNRNGDSLMPKEVFDSSMALVKRDIKQANLILGLGWGLDTMTKQGKICFSKENDSAAYYQLLQSGRLLNDTIRPLRRMVAKVDSLKRKITRERKKLAGYLTFVKDSMAQVVLPDSVAVAKIRLDTTQKSVLLDSMALAQRSDTLAGLDTLLSNAFREIRTLTARRLVSIEHIDSSQREKGKLVVHGRTTYNIIDKIWYVTCQLFKDRLRLLGLIITALMLSLGAPFWFDLLKKLVSLRGAGVKPEEKKPPTTPTGGGANNTVPQPGEGGDNVRLLAAVPVAPLHNVNAHTTDPAEQALDSLTQQLAGHAGVVAIGLKPQPGQPPSMALEVMVKDQATADALAQQPGNTQKLSNGTTMPIVYTITGANLFHGGKMGSEIGNQTGTLGQGTLGCFLQRQDSNQQFMLSCWHVMKDNANWAEPPLQKTIVQNSQPIGTITDGCLTDTIDVGIAAFTSPPIEKNPDIVITAQHRAVKAFDALVSTPVKLYGKVSKLQQAQVFHHKINAQLEYPGNTIHNFVDVFSISVKDSSTGAFSSPTAPGDSGAVVTDLNGVPLGMVVGGNNTFTYVVKFTNVFNPGMPYSDYSFIVNA